MTSTFRDHIRKFHREFDGWVGKAIGAKPFGASALKTPTSELTIQNFVDFSYSKQVHFNQFQQVPMYANQTPLTCDLKVYQDLFMVTFILNNVKPGSRLLEIGGGQSRMVAWLKNDFEIWNLDKLEGLGFGPRSLIEKSGFRLVKDYIGSFNPELPDRYFDLIFSISTIEHIPEDPISVDNCIADIKRLLAPQGLSVHCVDALLHAEHFFVHPLVRKISEENPSTVAVLDFDRISNDADLWCLPPFAYYTRWFPLTKRRLKYFGRPFSINILWRKDSD